MNLTTFQPAPLEATMQDIRPVLAPICAKGAAWRAEDET
jgi:hypothetical protein